MGYWNTNELGQSLIENETGMEWGDEPADVMDVAIDRIRLIFQRDLQRLPSADELRAGLEFSMRTFRDTRES